MNPHINKKTKKAVLGILLSKLGTQISRSQNFRSSLGLRLFKENKSPHFTGMLRADKAGLTTLIVGPN